MFSDGVRRCDSQKTAVLEDGNLPAWPIGTSGPEPSLSRQGRPSPSCLPLVVTGGRTGAPLKEEPQHFFFLLQNLKNKIRAESRERIFPASLSQYVPCPAPIQGVGSCLLQFVVKLLSNQGCVARSLFSSLPVLGTSLAFAIIKQSSHIFFF